MGGALRPKYPLFSLHSSWLKDVFTIGNESHHFTTQHFQQLNGGDMPGDFSTLNPKPETLNPKPETAAHEVLPADDSGFLVSSGQGFSGFPLNKCP